MSISASMVKDLREKTGAGMMDCKKALEECGGDVEKAVDWLRQKGLAKAAKRADRATSEGLVATTILDGGKRAVMVEVKCETDFVARGDKFREFAAAVVDHVAASSISSSEEASTALQDKLTETISSTGENITIGRIARAAVANGVIGCYVHSNGKIAVLVEVNSDKVDDGVQDVAKNIAMQIAATAPLALSGDALDPALIEREREVYRQKAKEEGKPDNIIDKIADGAVKKYCKEVCLMEQPYIRDDKMTIADLLQQAGKAAACSVTVGNFTRVQLGADAE